MKSKFASLDLLFSEFIRKRAMPRCERCLTVKTTWKQLQCSHFYGRRKRSVRWDEDNGTGLCGACHLYFTANPNEHVEWQKERLGDRFDDLKIRANTPGKPDISLLIIYYQGKIKEI